MSAQNKSRKQLRLRVLAVAMLVVGCLLLTVGALGVYDYFSVKSEGADLPSNEAVTSDAVVPSENKPAEISTGYVVPAGQPRVIEIPSISVEAYVQRVGITPQGAMATPNNIYFTGWYVNSVGPGEQGLSIINGHVGGRYSPGIFENLKNTKQGEKIRVQMGDLSWREFEITSVNTYPVEESGEALFDDDPTVDSELHLITCEGNYNSQSDTYDQRVIVVAKRLNN